jgi:hypothetical protein
MGGLLGAVFIILPSVKEPEASRNIAIISIIVASLSAVWFVKLCIDAIRDKRRGVERGPAKVSGWFHVWFGLTTAVGGVVCSWLTLDAARLAGGGVWTFYYGMIVWGIGQMMYGGNMIRRQREQRVTAANDV